MIVFSLLDSLQQLTVLVLRLVEMALLLLILVLAAAPYLVQDHGYRRPVGRGLVPCLVALLLVEVAVWLVKSA